MHCVLSIHLNSGGDHVQNEGSLCSSFVKASTGSSWCYFVSVITLIPFNGLACIFVFFVMAEGFYSAPRTFWQSICAQCSLISVLHLVHSSHLVQLSTSSSLWSHLVAVIPLKPFSCLIQLHVFSVMPFGFYNAPRTFRLSESSVVPFGFCNAPSTLSCLL